MWFHSHRWVIANVDYIPPRGIKVTEIEQGPAAVEMAEKLLCGQSILQLQCSVCGDISQRQVLGKFEKPSGETKS
jgi:hypothetical protein